VSCLLAVGLVLSACFSTTRIPGARVSALSAVAGDRPHARRVRVRGYDGAQTEVEPETRMTLVIQHEGRPLRLQTVPMYLRFDAAGFHVDRQFFRLTEVTELEIHEPDAGLTALMVVGLVLGFVATMAVIGIANLGHSQLLGSGKW